MISVLGSRVVDHGIEPLSGQTKDYARGRSTLFGVTNDHIYVPLVVSTFRSFIRHDLSPGLQLD
jgi:hypothetical protein